MLKTSISIPTVSAEEWAREQVAAIRAERGSEPWRPAT
jgi:hypothetical protein